MQIPRRSFLRAASVVPALGVLAWSGATWAEAPDGVLGVWRFGGGKAQREAVDAAIEAAVAELSILIQGIARKRIKESNRVSALLSIGVEGNEIAVVQPGLRSIRAPKDGSAVQWKSEHGDRVQVTHKLAADHKHFVQTLHGEGDRVNTFDVSKDGSKLSWKTKITSKRLPVPIEYRLTYVLVED